jgi:hypothetical protein
MMDLKEDSHVVGGDRRTNVYLTTCKIIFCSEKCRVYVLVLKLKSHGRLQIT